MTACWSTITHFNCHVTVSCRAKVSATLQRLETRAWPRTTDVVNWTFAEGRKDQKKKKGSVEMGLEEDADGQCNKFISCNLLNYRL